MTNECTAGSFFGPDVYCVGTLCLECSQWRYGQCSVGFQVVYGLVFGLGGAVLLIFLAFVGFFTYKVCTRQDRYQVLT